MRLVSYLHDGRSSFGVVMQRGLCDIRPRWADGPKSLLEALQAGKPALQRIERLLATATTEDLIGELTNTLASPPEEFYCPCA